MYCGRARARVCVYFLLLSFVRHNICGPFSQKIIDFAPICAPASIWIKHIAYTSRMHYTPPFFCRHLNLCLAGTLSKTSASQQLLLVFFYFKCQELGLFAMNLLNHQLIMASIGIYAKMFLSHILSSREAFIVSNSQYEGRLKLSVCVWVWVCANVNHESGKISFICSFLSILIEIQWHFQEECGIFDSLCLSFTQWLEPTTWPCNSKVK